MSGIFIVTPSIRKVTCALMDVAVLTGSFVLASGVQVGREVESIADLERFYLKMTALTASLLLCFYYNDLYGGRAPRDRKDLLLRLVKSYVAAGVLLSLLNYAVPALALDPGVLLIYFPSSMLFMLFWRACYFWALESDSLVENVLILGTGPAAQEMARVTLSYKEEGYRVIGFATEDPAQVGKKLVNPSVIGTIDQLPSLSERFKVDTVLVALEDRRGKLPVKELLHCKLGGIRVEEASSFYETLTGQIPVRGLHPSALIFSQGFHTSPLFRGLRRALEFCFAFLGLLVSLPVLVIGSLLIWLESGRPILYRQERVGQKGKIFSLYKLRTMKPSAEQGTGAVWAAAEGDPRVTKLGRFLRMSRIDELPQLLNVLKGEMSLVGPRPERPYFVERLQRLIPYYSERHCVKPGITGWAQIRYGYGSSVEEAEVKLRYDLYYIKHMNLWLDLMVILDTAKVMLLRKGAR